MVGDHRNWKAVARLTTASHSVTTEPHSRAAQQPPLSDEAMVAYVCSLAITTYQKLHKEQMFAVLSRDWEVSKDQQSTGGLLSPGDPALVPHQKFRNERSACRPQNALWGDPWTILVIQVLKLMTMRSPGCNK